MISIMKPIAEVDNFHITLTQNRTTFTTTELKFSYLICNVCTHRNLLLWCNRVALVCQASRNKKLFKNLDFRRFLFPQGKLSSQFFPNFCNTGSSNDWSECETSFPNFSHLNIHFINLLLYQHYLRPKFTKLWYFAMPKKLVKLFLLSFTFCISFQEKIAKLKKKSQTKISPEKVRALVISLFYERFCLVWQRKPVLTSSPFTILFFNHER